METFEKELEILLNKYSIDSLCNTPDFMLAKHIVNYIDLQANTLKENAEWHGWSLP